MKPLHLTPAKARIAFRRQQVTSTDGRSTDSQRGTALLSTIAALIVCAALSMGLSSLASLAARTKVRKAVGARAYYLALSGANYVSSLDLAAFEDLAGGSKQLSLGNAGIITIAVSEKDAEGDYPFTVTGTVDQGSTQEGAFSLRGKRHGSEYISFADDLAEFASPVESEPARDIIVIDEDVSAVILGDEGRDSYGAVWYSGNSSLGGCRGGECRFGGGFRAYFSFNFENAARNANSGDGFVFAVINGAENDAGRCGGDLSMGELLGYAGPGKTVDRKGLIPPKFGVEFDIYKNEGSKTPTLAGSRCDGAVKDHVAYVYWGFEDDSGTCGDYTTYPCSYDDNRHSRVNTRGGVVEAVGSGLGGDQPVNPASKNIVDTAGYYVKSGADAWLHQGGHNFRMEVTRAKTVNRSGRYEYKLKSWVDCRDCDDVLVDYSRNNPTLEKTVELNAANHAFFDTFLFGWTMGSGDAVERVPVSDFRLAFK